MKKLKLKIISLVIMSVLFVTLISCDLPFIESRPIDSVKINGVKMKKYTLIVPEKEAYDLPIVTVTRYLKKYCGIKIKVSEANEEVKGNKLIIGGNKADGSEYSQFEAEIYMKDGDIHLGCATPTTAQRVIYAFFHKYLNSDGKISAEIPNDGTVIYHTEEPDWDDANPELLTIQDKIVRGCYKLQEILEFDHSQGKYFTYQGPKGYMNTIEESRSESAPKEKQRTTNCVIVGNWVMKDAGFYQSGIYNHTYDGTTGYTFSKEAKPFFEENFEVIDMRDKGVSISELQKNGTVWPGDIIGFTSHNQMIMPNQNAFDAGRGWNTEIPESGAKFIRWLGQNPYPSMTVGFIIRSKDATKY